MRSLWCGDAEPWGWRDSEEVRAFEAEHAACDDGTSVGIELIVVGD